ncbi:MAG: type I 3-dehydroquinate dehydratase [bacterium]|nr:type I 3-dehydroquinate dehydratase [bacterium]
MTLQFGSIALGSIPRIAAIIERPLPEPELSRLRESGISILEFRADQFPGGIPALKSYLESTDFGGFARLATVRVDYPADTPLHPARVPAFESRTDAFETLLPLVDAVDVEVESPERAALVRQAREAQRLVVLSSHDFTKTPRPERFEEIVREAEALQVNILKLAVFARDPRDLQRVLAFTKDCRFPHLVTIAMGEYGLISRVAAPFFGSLISYGFIDQANAPGQLSAADLHAEFLRYHPAYRADFESRRPAT